MTHGKSNPLQTLRMARLLAAFRTAAEWFIIVFIAGMGAYGIVFATVGTTIEVWLAFTVMLAAAFIAANVSLYVYHKEVFRL